MYEQLDELLMRRAIDSSSCGITVADMSISHQPLVYINRTFERMSGYGKEEVLGKNCRFLQGDTEQLQARHQIKQALNTSTDCTVVLANYKKSGELFYNELHLAPLKNNVGKVTHFVGVQTDITERVQLQQQLDGHLKDLENKVKERTLELNNKNIALQELLSQMELEKRATNERINANVDSTVMPLLQKVRAKLSPSDRVIVDVLQQNLMDLTSSFGQRLSRKLYQLSPKEIEICTLIVKGLSTKEIADFFNISPSTVENQRNNIRKKLDISGKPINLTTYLLTFFEETL